MRASLLQVRLRAADALLTAVEHSTEAVKITNEDFEIQVRCMKYFRFCLNGAVLELSL